MRCWIILGVLLYPVSCFCSPASNGTEPLKSEQAGGFIVVAGGNDFDRNGRQSVYLMNTYTHKWCSMADLPIATFGSQLFYVDGKLLIAGGSMTPASFLIYNSKTPTWTALTDLNHAVGYGACGAILGGSLYLLGGSVQQNGSLVMDPFNFPNWVGGAQLRQARWCCGAAALLNNIYTCGHQSIDANGKTCEKYDPVSNSWSFIASMNDYRMGKILVALNGYLYAVGGNDFGTSERYDPATNVWTYIQSVNDHGRSFSAAATDGRLIYLVGGCDEIVGCGPGTETNTMEAYIPELNEWVVLRAMPEAREDPAIVYLPQLPM